MYPAYLALAWIVTKGLLVARNNKTLSGDSSPAQALSRVERKRIQRIRYLEETAAQVFAERGYDGTNLEEIASRLDMRGASLYHYFSSKEELFRRCIEHTSSEVLSRLTAIAESSDPPLERLRRLFEEQVLIEIRDYPVFVPLFLRMYVPVPALNDRILEIRRTQGDVFQKVADQALGKASKKHLKDRRIAVLLAFGSISYIPDWYHSTGPLPPEEFAKKVASMVVSSLTAES
jgi:AcrR family transcriptional regulator